MREKRRKFTPEFKSEAVRLVVDTSRPIAEVAREIGVHEGTLGNWVNQYRAETRRRRAAIDAAGAGAAAGTRAGEPRVADEDGVLGKGGRLFRPGVSVSEKYSFIDAEKAHYPVVKMCTWLKVSTSGFYAWQDRPASATTRRRARLAVLVQATFDASDGTYGYRRIHAALLRQGEDCGPNWSATSCGNSAWRAANHGRGGPPRPCRVPELGHSPLIEPVAQLGVAPGVIMVVV